MTVPAESPSAFDLREILAAIRSLEARLPVRQFLGVSDLAERLGVSDQYLRNRFWLLPDWGRTEVPGKLLWSSATVDAWLGEKSLTERDEEWRRLSSPQKAALASRRRG